MNTTNKYLTEAEVPKSVHAGYDTDQECDALLLLNPDCLCVIWPDASEDVWEQHNNKWVRTKCSPTSGQHPFKV